MMTCESGIETGELEDRDNSGEGRSQRRRLNCLERLALRMAKKKAQAQAQGVTANVINNEKLMELLRPARYKPQTVDQMARETKFTRSEVKDLYRAFKGDCPTGIIDEIKFKEVYQSIFPLGESAKYAHLVFNSIDKQKTGGITFGDFMDFLSVLSKGSERDKILWTFQFYDVNSDGCISRDEMIKVTDSIYDLVGESGAHPRLQMQSVEQVFSSMDTNRDGVVTEEEFVKYCTTNRHFSSNLLVLP